MSSIRKAIVLGMFLVSPFAAVAQTAGDGGILVWPKGVPPEGIAHKEDFGNHILSISHREENGKVEVHQTKADVMVIPERRGGPGDRRRDPEPRGHRAERAAGKLHQGRGDASRRGRPM